jgi:fucose 4-O-acetylase-like acetyltransferase
MEMFVFKIDRTPDTGHRIGFIDALKGFTIFCVVYGHSIENFKKGIDFWHNPVWEFIYSFHMPLFYVLSGFFFQSSLQLKFKSFLYKKTTQLLLPYFVWLILSSLYRLIKSLLVTSTTFDWLQELKGLFFPFDINPWFLRELFISYCIVYAVCKLFKKWHLVFMLSICFVLFMPYGALQRFLMPMFLFGILLNNNYKLLFIHRYKLLFGSIFIFVICLFFWDGNYTIYITGFPPIINIRELLYSKILIFNFSNMHIAAFRLLIGVSGSALLYALFQIIYRENILFICLSEIGKYSLAIYILHIYIIYKLLHRLIDFSAVNIWIYNLAVTPLIALLVLCFCIVIAKIIHKNKFAEILFFGASFQRLSK